MFLEFKIADESGSKVAVNVHSIAFIVPADESTTRITFVGGAADVWVAEKYGKVLKRMGIVKTS